MCLYTVVVFYITCLQIVYMLKEPFYATWYNFV